MVGHYPKYWLVIDPLVKGHGDTIRVRPSYRTYIFYCLLHFESLATCKMYPKSTSGDSRYLGGGGGTVPRLAAGEAQLGQGLRGEAPEVANPPRPFEPQSKPGIKMVYPEACKELRRRPQLFLAGTAPY